MALFNFDVVKRAIGDVGAQLKKLREKRETAMRAREDLQSLPLCKADFQALLENWVDRQGAGFVERLQVGAAYYLRNPMAALPENVKAPTHPTSVLTACRNPQDMATVAGLEANLFYVLAPAIKEGIARALSQMDFAEAGHPRAERFQTIEALDAKIIGARQSRERAFGSGRSSRNTIMNETDVAQVLVGDCMSFEFPRHYQLKAFLGDASRLRDWHASSPASR